MAQLDETTPAALSAYYCTKCLSILVHFGNKERSDGNIVPSECLSVNNEIYMCGGRYETLDSAGVIALMEQVKRGNVTAN